MRYGKYVAAVVLVWGLAMPAQAREFTLGQAVEQALKANPGVESKVRALERARLEMGVAQSYFWPRISMVASTSELRNSGDVSSLDDVSSHSDSYGLRLTLNLFAGYSHLNNLQRTRIEAAIAEARQRQAELELGTNVQIQFLQLLKARKDMVTVEESIKRLETQLKAAQAFVRVGMAPYVNVLQNEVELSEAHQQKIRTANAIRSCEVQLNQFLGFNPSEQIQYSGYLEDYPHTVPLTEEEALRQAVALRPDLVIAQKSVEAARAQSKATAGKFLPQVDLTFDNMRFRRDYREPRYKDYSRGYSTVGVNMSWVLFEGGQASFAYAADRKQMQALEKEYENSRSSAQAEVIKAWMDIRTAEEVLVTARKGVSAAEESYAMADKRYNTSVGTITELLNAQNRLTQAKTQVSQALMEYQSARARLFFYVGIKNEKLQ